MGRPTSTGSSSTTQPDHTAREITVLVTGFGPFQDKFPVNPSFEITQALPELLPATSSSSSSSSHDPAIRIIRHRQAIRVCYDEVRELIPRLHEAHSGTVDLVMHIGMASGRKFYCAERYGHRDGYVKNKDLDGKVLGAHDGEERFGDCPSTMATSLDYEALVRDWQRQIEDIPEASPGHRADVRQSEDAGRFLCDYIYFNSLAYFARRCGDFEGGGDRSARPVLFLHVPAESDAITLGNGRAVAVALIRAMVKSYMYTTPPPPHEASTGAA